MTELPVSAMPMQERLRIAIDDALPHLPGPLQAQVRELFTPQTVATIAAGAVADGVAQFFGVGEVLDAVVAGAGAVLLGKDVITVGEHFADFLNHVAHATTKQDLALAGATLAAGIIIGAKAASWLATRKTPELGEGELGAREEAALTHYSYDEAHLPQDRSRLESIQTFVGDRFANAKNAIREHLSQHRAFGESLDATVREGLLEITPLKVGTAVVAALGGRAFVLHLVHAQQAQLTHQPPQAHSAPEHASQWPHDNGTLAAGTIGRFDGQKLELDDNGARTQFDFSRLAEHARDPVTFLEAIRDAQVRGHAIRLEVEHGGLVVQDLGRPRAARQAAVRGR